MGMFDFLSQGNGILSGTPNAAPSTWQNAAGLFGATAKDVGTDMQGGQGNNLANFATQQKALATQRLGQQAQQAIVAAGNDPDKLKAAIMSYTAAGGDPSNLIAAAKFGSPDIKTYSPQDNVAAINPINGAQTMIQQGTPKPDFNQPFNAATGVANPAYQAYQKSLYDARAAANAAYRAPKAAPKATGAIAIPHPGSQY